MLLNFDSDHDIDEARLRVEVFTFADAGVLISNDAAQHIAARYAEFTRVRDTWYRLAEGQDFDPNDALGHIGGQYRRLERDLTDNVRELMELSALAALIHKSMAAVIWHLA